MELQTVPGCVLHFVILYRYFKFSIPLTFLGGRRSGVTLGHILQFATGAEEEPILGFTINPSLEATTTFLPTSNTFTCCLKLPHATNELPLPPSQELHSLYDLAFLNAFFGHI